MCVTATCMRNIRDEVNDVDSYFAFDTKKLLLDNRQKEMITTTLNNSNKAFAGITLKFQDPIICKFAVIAYVKVDNVYNKELVKQSIKTSLANYFLNTLEDIQFIAKSDLLKKIIDDCENIVAIDLDIISELAEDTYKNGYYDKYVQRANDLMTVKNHDYGEAWRGMLPTSYTDFILTKIERNKSILANNGKTLVSEGADANYFDMLNYAVFGLIKIDEQNEQNN